MTPARATAKEASESPTQIRILTFTHPKIHTLGARGFSCAVSDFGHVFKKVTRARVFGLRPKTGRPAADEAPRG